jgi:hypothetical protein
MTEEVQGRRRKLGPLRLALATLLAVLAVLFVPPLVSLSRYKSKVTQLMSTSLGRPVRLSSVELHLLPRPALLLTDLTVEDDPAYGAEPVLHASTVTASFRILSLWRGKLEISRISVDDASLNLVRTDVGRWNLDTLFRTAAAPAGTNASGGTQHAAGSEPGSNRRATPFPYLEATNSRINFKSGSEKLPLSLVNTDLSFWQEEPGDWRIRMRGQPARTDVSLDLADTGVVLVEASVKRAGELREMPVHLDMEWRDAQLGQLARLIIGYDPGWRGDLTAELNLDGTADAAQIKTRLRATGVHRAEFAPAAPLDFDATCGLLYHFSSRAFENLACDSPLGDGRIHVAGDLSGDSGLTHFSVGLDHIPVAAGLDAMRTVRSGFGPGLEVKGTITGKITYAELTPEQIAAVSKQNKDASKAKRGKAGSDKAHPAPPGPLTGSLVIEGFQLSGDGLGTPIQTPRLVLQPVGAQPSGRDFSTAAALYGSVAISAGGASPLTVTPRLTLSGYQLALRGQASVVRARELAYLAGMANASALDALAGDPVVIDLTAEGPWLPAETTPFSSPPPAVAPTSLSSQGKVPIASPPQTGEPAVPATDTLTGTVTLHNANWKADYLASHVEISNATLHIDPEEVRWDDVDFSYGPVKGMVNLRFPAVCNPPILCTPRFDMQFAGLDAGVVQAAILGAHEQGTLISELIARLNPSKQSSALAWPELEGTVKADSLILGPVTLQGASATLRIVSTGAEITDLEGGVLGGSCHGSGTFRTGDRPTYTLEGQFEKLNPVAVGELLGLRWSGGVMTADGKIELSGFTDKDLAASAKGSLHFEWRHGAVGAQAGTKAVAPAASAATSMVPPALAHFDRWTADAEIANGTIALKQNQVQQGGWKRVVDAKVTFGDPPRVIFPVAHETIAKKR